VTRRWLKPRSFVDLFQQGVGIPFEIFRVKVNGHSVDVYAKDGDCMAYLQPGMATLLTLMRCLGGVYHSIFALIPDYDFGFTVLTAVGSQWDFFNAARSILPNLITTHILPVLDSIAAQQSDRRFAGNYTAPGLNSSVTFTTDSTPGLKLTQWLSNGTDILADVFGKLGTDDFRLVPNGLYDEGSGKVGFTGVYQESSSEPPPPADGNLGNWYFPCQTWTEVSEVTYGDVGLEQFVFEVDGASSYGGGQGQGKAKRVRSLALEVGMVREE
jgi:hypothetical protein